MRGQQLDSDKAPQSFAHLRSTQQRKNKSRTVPVHPREEMDLNGNDTLEFHEFVYGCRKINFCGALAVYMVPHRIGVQHANLARLHRKGFAAVAEPQI